MSDSKTNSVNDLKEITQLWKKKFSQLSSPYTPLDPHSYTVTWNSRMRSRAGMCNPGLGLIVLNPHLLKTKEQFEQTLVHEICHLAVSRAFPRAEAHGMRWKKLMVLMGFPPARCHNLEGAVVHRQKRWAVLCECRTHEVSTRVFNNMKRGTRYKCLKCKTILQGKIPSKFF